MIRLIKRPERRDIELGYGVTVTVKPVTTWVHRAAQHSAERMVRELAYEGGLIEAAGGSIHDIPDLHQREGMLGLRDQMMLQALARHAIVSWQGTLDIRGVDLTSAARLLPRQVTPSEIADPSETELRSFSPKDIADIVAAVLAS